MPAFGIIDTPAEGENITGTIPVSGWAIDDRGVDHIEVMVDGKVAGEARYGISGPDVADIYLGGSAGPDSGFVLQLDTKTLSNSEHHIRVISLDKAGNRSHLIPRDITVTVEN